MSRERTENTGRDADLLEATGLEEAIAIPPRMSQARIELMEVEAAFPHETIRAGLPRELIV